MQYAEDEDDEDSEGGEGSEDDEDSVGDEGSEDAGDSKDDEDSGGSEGDEDMIADEEEGDEGTAGDCPSWVDMDSCHRFSCRAPGVVQCCDECEKAAASVWCEVCAQHLCNDCDGWIHKRGESWCEFDA